MRHRELERTLLLPRDRVEVFAFFAEPRNLEEITPPWLRFRIVEAPATLGRGALLRYRVPGGPLAPVRTVERWLREIFDYRHARLRELLGGRPGAD